MQHTATPSPTLRRTSRLSALAALGSLLCLVAVPALAGANQAAIGIRLVIVDSCDISAESAPTAPAVTVSCSTPTPYAIRKSGATHDPATSGLAYAPVAAGKLAADTYPAASNPGLMEQPSSGERDATTAAGTGPTLLTIYY